MSHRCHPTTARIVQRVNKQVTQEGHTAIDRPMFVRTLNAMYIEAGRKPTHIRITQERGERTSTELVADNICSNL